MAQEEGAGNVLTKGKQKTAKEKKAQWFPRPPTGRTVPGVEGGRPTSPAPTTREPVRGGRAPGLASPPPPQPGVIDETIKTLQQMLKGVQMWREAWRSLQGFATEGRPEPTLEGMMQMLRGWGTESAQAGRQATQKLREPFYRWRGW